MSNVLVRRIIEGDLPSVERVIASHNLANDKYYTASMPLSNNSALEGERQAVLIAMNSAIVIGFLNLHWNQPNEINRHEAEFEVVVDPGFRKLGVGKKLLDVAVKHIADKTNVKTIVAKIKNGNIGSEMLCSKLGFSKVCQDSLGAYWEKQIKR